MQSITEMAFYQDMPVTQVKPVVPDLDTFDILIPDAITALRARYRAMIALTDVDGYRITCTQEQDSPQYTVGQYVVTYSHGNWRAGVATKVTKTKATVSLVTKTGIAEAWRRRPYDPEKTTGAEYAHEMALRAQYQQVLNPREYYREVISLGAERLCQKNLDRRTDMGLINDAKAQEQYLDHAQREYDKAIRQFPKYDKRYPEQFYIDTYVQAAALVAISEDPDIGIAAWTSVSNVTRHHAEVYPIPADQLPRW